MKKFWINTLIVIIFMTGWGSTVFYCKSIASEWYNFIAFMGSLLITIPAINWWVDYFKKVFETKDK